MAYFCLIYFIFILVISCLYFLKDDILRGYKNQKRWIFIFFILGCKKIANTEPSSYIDIGRLRVFVNVKCLKKGRGVVRSSLYTVGADMRRQPFCLW